MHRLAKVYLAVVLAAVIMAGMITSAQAFNGNVIMLVDGGSAVNVFSIRGETVGDFLARTERTLRELDIINVELDSIVQNGDVIRITRREHVTHTERTAIAFRTVYVHSPEVKAGEEKITQQGVNGVSELTWKRFMVDGVVEEEELVGERVLTAPVDNRVEMGFRSVPVSQFDFEAEFDENHEPIGYTQVLRGQRSAGYWAREGARTATGRIAELGVVAVNPRVIPYGSRLFIQSADGKFIYGYAIAADTGSDLVKGVIDIDCFYPVYADALRHGIKVVDVFVLG